MVPRTDVAVSVWTRKGGHLDDAWDEDLPPSSFPPKGTVVKKDRMWDAQDNAAWTGSAVAKAG